MKKILSLVLVLMIAAACVLSACAPSSGPEEPGVPTEPGGQKPDETSPPSGKTHLNISLEAVGATMDPYNAGLTPDQRVLENFLEGLVHADEKTSEITPRLAKEFAVSEDGLVYTFTLRDDVYFHNGDQLKASDVVFSYGLAREADQMGKYVSEIEDVQAPDDVTVVITLNKPYFPFIYYVDKIKIVGERAVTEMGDSFGAVAGDYGTGPYRLTEYNPSSKITLEAFPDYYRGEASIKTIDFHVIVDQSTALIAFQSGEIDYIEVPVANWDEIEGSGLYTTEITETGHITYLALNMGQDGPLSNKLVRQAIQYAIDKQAVIDIVFNGLAGIADHEIKPGLYSGAQETDFVYEYNPEKAKALLVEAGYADGCDIGDIQAAPEIYQMTAEVIQAQLAEVGIKAGVLKGDLSAMVVDWREGNYDAVCCAYTPAFTYDYARSRIDSRNPVAFLKYDRCEECKHEYIDRLLDEASIETDETKRNALYLELEEHLLEVAGSVPIKYSVRAFAWDKGLNAAPYLNLFQVYNWSWK